MKTCRSIPVYLACLAALPFLAQAQTTCSLGTLSGSRSVVITGRNLNSSTALSAAYQSVGSASFDGAGNVTFTLTSNSNQSQGVAQTLTGTYTLAGNCVGSLNISAGDTAAYTLVASNKGKNFTITGQNATYALTGNGAEQPVSCIPSTLSGTYAFNGNGFSLSSATITGVNSIGGLLTFDGKGTISGNWSIISNGNTSSTNLSGNYTITQGCKATGTVTDGNNVAWSLTFTVTQVEGADFGLIAANASGEFSAAGHATFTNPGVALVNSASSVSSGTPAGSLFALYGHNLASGLAQQGGTVPLPGNLLGTSVTINGETAPLFFVSPGQINAQMPWDIKPGIANVVVTGPSGTSNPAAVVVPGYGVPGIFPQYPTNAAVVQNPNFGLNTQQAPAHVGDVVVAYFTGGGPVNAAGPLVTGSYNPNGISPVTPTSGNSVTVGGQQATVNYIGLTGSLVGVYQANFVIPNVPAGKQNLVLTIGGVSSVVTTVWLQ